MPKVYAIPETGKVFPRGEDGVVEIPFKDHVLDCPEEFLTHVLKIESTFLSWDEAVERGMVKEGKPKKVEEEAPEEDQVIEFDPSEEVVEFESEETIAGVDEWDGDPIEIEFEGDEEDFIEMPIEKMKVSELKEELEEKGVSYPKNAKKAVLAQLVELSRKEE